MRYIIICLLICSGVTSNCQINKPNDQALPSTPSATINVLPTSYSPNLPINYTRAWQSVKPVSGIAELLSSSYTTEVLQTTIYSDGLGRTLQEVRRSASPLGKDLVTPKIYDNAGREIFSYLPYVASTNNGLLKLNAFADQLSFMQAQPQFAGEQVFYAKAFFENSPEPVKTHEFLAGNSYAGSNKGIEYKFESNEDYEVRKWEVAPIVSTTIVDEGYFPSSKLIRSIIIDAAGKRTVEYKNKEGRLVLKKIEISHNSSALLSSHNGWLNTYYVYDYLGNVKYIITPRAVQWLLDNNWNTLPADIIEELCYVFNYDDLGRKTEVMLPGESIEAYVYDSMNRLVFKQDRKQKDEGKWIAILYDLMDRQVITGIISFTGSRSDLQNYTDGFPVASAYSYTVSIPVDADQFYDTRVTGRSFYKAASSIHFLDGFTSENGAEFFAEIDGSNSTATTTHFGVPLPTGHNLQVLTQVFYDDYSWVNACDCGLPASFIVNQLQGGWVNSQPESQFPYPLPLVPSALTTNLVTGVKTRILEDGIVRFVATVKFYDEQSRQIQSFSTNYKGGADIITTQYSYDNKVLGSRYHQIRFGSAATSHDLYSRNEYHGNGRLFKTFKKINNSPEKLTTTNYYNEFGQVSQLVLGDNLTTLDYRYDVNGTLKSVNEAFARGQSNDKFFGVLYSKDYGFEQPQYNGNLAGIQWRSLGDGEQRALGFSYDPAGRLMKSDFTQKNNGWNTSAGVDFSTVMGNGADPNTAYDVNGNIKAFTQKGLKLYQSDVLDNVAYNYQNNEFSNTVSKITEGNNSGTSQSSADNFIGDFKDNTSNSFGYDFQYDKNGNTVVDYNKGIDLIEYNILNLPNKIQVAGKGSLIFKYDASGIKYEKMMVPSTGQPVTYSYQGAYLYRNDELMYIGTEEGRIRPIVIAGGATSFAFDYFIKDHLGNVRMILTDEVRTDINPQVSFEQGNNTLTDPYYERVNASLTGRPGDFGTPATNGDKVQLLRKNATSIGVGKMLKVMVKDQVNVTVDYYFQADPTDNSASNGINNFLSNILSSLNSPAVSTAIKNSGSIVTQQLGLDPSLSSFFSPQQGSVSSSTPKAYLNILFFDEQFRFIPTNSKTVAVTTSGSRQTITEAFVEAPKNGYAYIYVSNESNNLVYFDNFQVSHARGPVLEENHYYPFGSKMTAICSRAMPEVQNSIGYQSKKLDEEFDVDLYDFHARSYDPQTGRFLQMDPDDQFASGYIGMGNAWINSVDPDGRSVLVVALIFAGVQLGADLIRSDFNMTIGEMGKSVLKGAVQGCMASVFGGSSLTNLKALGIAVSGQMPAYNLQLDNFSISISPAVLFGTDQLGFGASFSASMNVEGFQVGMSWTGRINAKSFGPSGPSKEGIFGVGGGYYGKDFGFGVYSSNFKTNNGVNQRVGGFHITSGDLSINYENDWVWGLPTGDGGDRFRTTGLRVAVKEFSLNLNMYTGDPDDKECAEQLGQNTDRPYQNINGHDTYIGTNANLFRAGVLSIGYGNYQIGLNSEKIRHIFQNRFAHDLVQSGASKWFQVMNKKWHPYFIYKTPTPFTTW